MVNNGVIQFGEGRAQFASTLQNNGTILPPVSRPGCALSFDGINDYVQVPGFLANAPDKEVTVEFWEKANALGLQAPFCPSMAVAGSVFAAYVPYGSNGNGVIYWEFGDITTDGWLIHKLPYSIVGTWQHFAFVASQSNNCMNIYMNGVLVASKTKMTPLVRTNLDLIIGGAAAGFPFNGQLDEFRIWNVARSQADIQATMNCSLTGLEPGLVAYWPMNECSGTNIYDASAPSAFAGTLVNGPLWVTSSIPMAPMVLAVPPSSLGTNSATLEAIINPNGSSTVAWFQWGTTVNYSNTTTASYVGNGSVAVANDINIASLVPGVTYHYRAVATNSVGASYGADGTLAIPAAPVPLLINIAQSGTNVTLSLPLSGRDFILEQNSDLRTTNWVPASALSTFLDTNITVTCPIGTSNLFYRLRKP